jgi:hypothetical protein
VLQLLAEQRHLGRLGGSESKDSLRQGVRR